MLREDERDGADSPPNCLGSKYSSGKLFGSPALQWTLLGLHSSFFPPLSTDRKTEWATFFFFFLSGCPLETHFFFLFF